MQHLTDDDLIRLYRDGDADAFDTLFDRHYTSVYNFSRMMLGSSGAPDEVLQEVFLAVAQNASKYVARGNFKAWLMRIVRNRCINRIQADRLRRATFGGDVIENVKLSGDARGPLERVDAREQAEIVRRDVERLPDRQREAIVLYAFEQMTYREIADVMEIPINTVKTLIRRGRAALATKLAGYKEEHDNEL